MEEGGLSGPVLDTPDTYAEIKHNLHHIYSIYIQINVWKREAIICDNAKKCHFEYSEMQADELSAVETLFCIFHTSSLAVFC